MAADWVRYTNVIAQTYRQGDTITNPQDQAILNSLVWTTGPTDTHDKLPTRTEAPLPKVQYWEIGNEPRVGLASSYNFTNSYTFLTPDHPVDSTHKYDYRERYASLTAAMRAVDPTIKVGPAMQWLNAVTEQELLNSILNAQPGGGYLPVDFIGYHPYQTIYSTPPCRHRKPPPQRLLDAQHARRQHPLDDRRLRPESELRRAHRQRDERQQPHLERHGQ